MLFSCKHSKGYIYIFFYKLKQRLNSNYIVDLLNKNGKGSAHRFDGNSEQVVSNPKPERNQFTNRSQDIIFVMQHV